MSLNISKRDDKEYLYFRMNGSKRIYLGRADEPIEARIKEAICYLDNKIRVYEEERQKLKNYIINKDQKFDMKYNLVIFDCDGVIYDKPGFDCESDKVAVSTWNILFKELKAYDTHEKLKQLYIDGVFKTYTEWTEEACNILKSFRLDRKTFEKIIDQRIFTQGAKEVFQILNKNNIKIAIITGSFESLAQRAKKELGNINNIYAHCKLIFNNNGLLEKWDLRPTDYKDKATFVKKVAKQYNIPLEKSVYIGDDVNDLAAFEEVGRAIAFNANKFEVREAADIVIESRNLQSILLHLCEIGHKSSKKVKKK